jgi:hypothetical protein
MCLLLIAGVVALIVGNIICKRAVEAGRTHPYGSVAARPSDIALSIGTAINVLGGICLAVSIGDWLFN